MTSFHTWRDDPKAHLEPAHELGWIVSIATSLSGAPSLLGEAKQALVDGLPIASLFHISESTRCFAKP